MGKFIPTSDQWHTISMLVSMSSTGSVVYQTTLDREFPKLDRDLLHLCIEDSIFIEDGYEDIAWDEVEQLYAKMTA